MQSDSRFAVKISKISNMADDAKRALREYFLKLAEK